VWLTGILTRQIGAGVQVTMPLEDGELSDAELWNCGQVVAAGGKVCFMHNDSATKVYDRYTEQHAKVVVVDGRLVAVSSESFTNRSFPVDDVTNGTAGKRWPANRDSDDCGYDFRIRYTPDPGHVVTW
jgi:hypothetical protein